MVCRRVRITSGIVSLWGVGTHAFTNISPIVIGSQFLVSAKESSRHSVILPDKALEAPLQPRRRNVLKMTKPSEESSEDYQEPEEQIAEVKEDEQPLVSWGDVDDVDDNGDDVLIDDYCAVMDDFGCEAYEDLAKSLDEKLYRWIRVEARPDVSIKDITTQGDVIAKIEEVRSYQSKYGTAELYPRKWHPEQQISKSTNYINGDGPPKKTTFSVLQFNALAEGLSSGPDVKTPFAAEKKSDNPKNSYGGFSQVPHPEISLDFTLRRWRILEVILGLTSIEPGVTQRNQSEQASSNQLEGVFDILAMQEIDRFRGFFAPLLRLFGYEGIFHPKTKSPGVPLGFYSDGCALFWKTGLFSLVSEERYQFRVGNQVMMLATLKHHETEKPLLVAVTHLQAKQSDTNEKIRCKQVDELLKRIEDAAEKVAKKYGLKSVQVIIAGDFNADPPCDITSTESSVRRVLSYHERVEDVDRNDRSLSRPTQFYSAYQVDPPSDDFYTTYKTRGSSTVKRTIDYIFHSDVLECTETLSVPTLEDLERGLLPGLRSPSDHLMIAAKFQVKDEK